MSSSTADIRVRLITEDDSEALRELNARSVDGGRVGIAIRHRVSPQEALQTRRADSHGVVAVTAEDRLVGSGWVSFSRVSDGADEVDLGWLHSLNVDPQWRRRGVASALTRARLDLVDQRPGPCVAAAAIQAGNQASLANARHWMTRSLGTVRVTPVPPPRRAPRDASVRIRRATDDDLPELAAGIRDTAARTVLAPVLDASALAAWLETRVRGERLREYVVAVDRDDRIVAGLGVEDESRLIAMEVVSMPLALTAANLVLRVVPRDRLLRNLDVRLPYVLPGREDAARSLWRELRWHLRDRGTGLVTAIDPTGPYAAVLSVPAWLPATTLDVVVRETAEMRLRDLPLGVVV